MAWDKYLATELFKPLWKQTSYTAEAQTPSKQQRTCVPWSHFAVLHWLQEELDQNKSFHFVCISFGAESFFIFLLHPAKDRLILEKKSDKRELVHSH